MIKTKVISRAATVAKVYYPASKKTKALLYSTTKQLLHLAKGQMHDVQTAASEISDSVNTILSKRYDRLKDIGTKIIEQG